MCLIGAFAAVNRGGGGGGAGGAAGAGGTSGVYNRMRRNNSTSASSGAVTEGVVATSSSGGLRHSLSTPVTLQLTSSDAQVCVRFFIRHIINILFAMCLVKQYETVMFVYLLNFLEC